MASCRCNLVISVVRWNFIAVLLIAVSSFASSDSILRGVITDSEGAAIAGAHIVVHWDQSGSTTGLASNVGIKHDVTVETNHKGEFVVDIPPGFYDVFVSAPAFAPESKKVRVNDQQPTVYKARMKADPLVTKELGDRF
jgi:hypothetical protein